MKNEDKGKLKYIGAVVVIALLAGIGLASAQEPGITPGMYLYPNWMSIVQNDPNSNALYVNDTFVHQGDAAVVVDFTNPVSHDGVAYGVNVTGAHKTNKGVNIGIRGRTSLDYSDQNGSATGYLAHSFGYQYHGHFRGVYGGSTPNSLKNWANDRTSTGLGGKFYAGPDDNHTLTLDTTGTYWVGGVYGEVNGKIDGTPTAGAVAGVIGIDNTNTTGTAQSYAGYFDGRVRVTDLPLGSATDEIVVADPDGVLRNSGKNMSALGADADWYNVSDPGNPPDGIDDSIYTYGKVGIGTSTPGANLEVKGDDRGYLNLTSSQYNSITGTGYSAFTICADSNAAVGGGRICLHPNSNGWKHGTVRIYSSNDTDNHMPFGNIEFINETITGGVATEVVNMIIRGDTGNVGIGTTDPQRDLHISDVLRLEPRGAAPTDPSGGDIYVNSNDHHIYCYLNGIWKQLDN